MAAKPPKTTNLPVMAFSSKKEWAEWLEKNYANGAGVWLRLAKKGSGETSVSYNDAVEVALCHGWIDGQLKAQDGRFYLQRFTPRSGRSIWSMVNKGKALALIESGEMRKGGHEAIEVAKATGRWEEAYDSSEKAEVPEDFRAALKGNPLATEFFSSLDRANRYAVLFRIQTAGAGERRALKISQLVLMLERGEKFHP